MIRSKYVAAVVVLVCGIVGLVLGMITNSDGSEPSKPSAACNRNYGTASQCIPLQAPGGKPVTCEYLTAQGFFKTPLVVRADPLNLMSRPGVRMATENGQMVVYSC